MIDWAKEIRAYREREGLLQEALAEALGVSQATVSRWESGRQRPDIESQQLLRPLLWGGLVNAAAVVLHAVRSAPSLSAVGDCEARLLAASPRFCSTTGWMPEPDARVPADLASHAPASWHVFNLIRERGMFEGKIASVAFSGRVQTVDGLMVSEELWYPLRLESGEIALRADVIYSRPANDAAFAALSDTPEPNIVYMDSLLDDVRRPAR
jgi:DNA-binding XRE family transcriptional regulator